MSLETNVRPKNALRRFISLALYLQRSLRACCRDMSGAEISLAHKLCCSLQLYVQPWVVTLHFPQPSSHSHCFKHCNTVTMCGGFYLSLTGLVVSLSRLGTAAPSSPPSHIHTHCLRERKTHSCHTVSARQKGSHRPAPPRFSQLTVRFWFSRAGRAHIRLPF